MGRLLISKKLFLASILFFVLIDLPLISLVVASSEMWSRTYGGAGEDVAYSLVETSDGGYSIAGATNGNVLLVKTDEQGNLEWNHTYGGGRAYSLVKTSDGGYAIAGYTNSFSSEGTDFWLIKTDEYGNMEWNRTYGGEEWERARSLIETSDGGFALAGYTDSFGAEGYDFWLVKTDESGVIPEFPSWISLPLLLVATLAAIIYKQRLPKPSSA